MERINIKELPSSFSNTRRLVNVTAYTSFSAYLAKHTTTLNTEFAAAQEIIQRISDSTNEGHDLVWTSNGLYSYPANENAKAVIENADNKAIVSMDATSLKLYNDVQALGAKTRTERTPAEGALVRDSNLYLMKAVSNSAVRRIPLTKAEAVYFLAHYQHPLFVLIRDLQDSACGSPADCIRLARLRGLDWSDVQDIARFVAAGSLVYCGIMPDPLIAFLSTFEITSDALLFNYVPLNLDGLTPCQMFTPTIFGGMTMVKALRKGGYNMSVPIRSGGKMHLPISRIVDATVSVSTANTGANKLALPLLPTAVTEPTGTVPDVTGLGAM